MNQISKMAILDSTIWCVTRGGVLAFTIPNQTFQRWTNTEGLASIQVSTIAVDSKKHVLFGYQNGLIQQFDPSTSSWVLFDEYLGQMVTCLYPKGDTLFVGLDIGISVYLLTKREVKETYRHLGTKFDVELPVRDIMIIGKEIWAATDEGVAKSRMEYPNLLDPNAWTDYTSANGLPPGSVEDFTILDRELIAATTTGTAVFRNNQWIEWNAGFPDANVFAVAVHQNQLFTATSKGVYVYSQNRWNQYSDERVCRSVLSAADFLWIGTDQGLVYYAGTKQKWVNSLPNCPASNLFSDMAVDRNNVLWCTSANTYGKGFYRFDGSRWTNINTQSDPKIAWNDVYAVAVDQSNAKWFGTWGRGILYWNEQDSFRIYDKQTGHLAGVSVDPEFAVVSDVAVDSSGTIWLLNFESNRNEPLVSVTQDSVWTYYGTAEGLTNVYCRRLAIDLQGRKWIGTDNQGIFIYDDNGTPSDKTDDWPVEKLTTSDGLESNMITALAVDRDGIVWIGTPNGLYYYDNNQTDPKPQPKYGIPSDNVTNLLVDGVNNLWVATSAGLSLFRIREYDWTHFHKDNSGLVSNTITALAMDYSTGKLYAGTNLGLSILETPFSRPLVSMSELKIYPNPFLPSKHGTMVVDNLTSSVSVSIFSESGYLVRRFSEGQVTGKQVFWNGLNDRGEPVSGGIYLVVEQNKSGERRIGKAALIR